MEMSVSFTDEDDSKLTDDYIEHDSVLGKVYIPKHGVQIDGPVRIRYEKHPWIEAFELDGISPERPKREGFGVKSIQGFMLSLNSVYSEAKKDFDSFAAEGKSDPNEFFLSVTERMISESGSRPLQFKRFCGLIENMWRIGNESAYSLAMGNLIPKIWQSEITRDIFLSSITEEFRDEISKIDTYIA